MIEESQETQVLEVVIHRREPASAWSIYELDTGSLLYTLTDSPSHLANDKDGTIKLEIQRTHEWELWVGLVLTGSAAFLKGVLGALAKQFGEWLAHQVARLGTQAKAEVRASPLLTVIVDPADLTRASEGISKLLKQAAKTGARVELIVEPGK
jgi:hypothetical protein